MLLEKYINEVKNNYSNIDENRKNELLVLSNYISQKLLNNNIVNLIFICTHNSRRSHISQIWAAKAAEYYGINNVNCYSGGTEATAFNPRAVKAMKKAGFEIEIVKDGDNPLYSVKVSDNLIIRAFSKTYDDDFIPKNNFTAVMTCSHADENCPYIPGAENRISITYDDPKDFDDTPQEEEKYDERCFEIAVEMFYVMKNVKK